MSVLVQNYAANWNQELYQQAFERAIPDPANPPAGLIAHFAAPGETGGWQVVDVWETEEAFRSFLEEKVIPAAKEIGAPPFDTSVVEAHNILIP
ncbi:hypothetical protein [Streptomyces sp. NPDC003635]